MTDAIPAANRETAETLAREAFARTVGSVIHVRYVMGYVGSNSCEFYAAPEATFAVRVLPTDEQSLTNWNDEFLDPYWNVELVDWPADIPRDATSFWVDGPSFTVEN